MLSAVVGGVWDLTTTWVRRRPNCRCVLKLPDGSELQLENLTKEEALALLQAHRAAPGAGTS